MEDEKISIEFVQVKPIRKNYLDSDTEIAAKAKKKLPWPYKAMAARIIFLHCSKNWKHKTICKIKSRNVM